MDKKLWHRAKASLGPGNPSYGPVPVLTYAIQALFETVDVQGMPTGISYIKHANALTTLLIELKRQNNVNCQLDETQRGEAPS